MKITTNCLPVYIHETRIFAIKFKEKQKQTKTCAHIIGKEILGLGYNFWIIRCCT